MEPNKIYDYIRDNGNPITADDSQEEFPLAVVPLVRSCWLLDPNLRPNFSEIMEKIRILMHSVWWTEWRDRFRRSLTGP